MQTAVAVLVSGVVALFGVTSAVLGFIAEANRLKPDEIHVSGRDCVYPANPAHTLGFCAIFLLVVAQIIASAAGGCCSCCRPPGGASYSNSTTTRRRVVGVVASVLSWVAAVVAVVYFWVGVTLNAPMTRRAKIAGPDEECYLLKGGIFVRAAVLSLVATSLGIMSCVLLRLPAATDAPPEQDPKFARPPSQGQANGQV
ncbi:protein MODIFYING WALL LIGNIN-1-like [Miscanthus floridulus]|uniref:protein MODIFYING WALL LIGNIN-1-like n=1 Tax=Miscanthus floridulus TaxID=154761 RepID=UPI003459F7B3